MAKGYLPYEVDQQLLLPRDMRAWLPDGHLALFVATGPTRYQSPRELRFAAPFLPFSAGELEGSALPSNGTITTEFRRALPDGLLVSRVSDSQANSRTDGALGTLGRTRSGRGVRGGAPRKPDSGPPCEAGAPRKRRSAIRWRIADGGH